MSDDDKLELEEDLLPAPVGKTKPDSVPKTKQDKRFAKLEERVKQLQ